MRATEVSVYLRLAIAKRVRRVQYRIGNQMGASHTPTDVSVLSYKGPNHEILQLSVFDFVSSCTYNIP